jgi:hypothetical protein
MGAPTSTSRHGHEHPLGGTVLPSEKRSRSKKITSMTATKMSSTSVSQSHHHPHPHESSMSSFLSRMANEASAALSDAYGHVMHGDDAGSSARIVWVIRPSRVPCNTGGGIVGGTTNNNNSGDVLSTISAPGGVDALTATSAALTNNGVGGGGDGISPTSSSYFPTASLFTQKFGEFLQIAEHREYHMY